ncbi:MAG: TraB/GumN family protein [Desulfobacterales bacterium]|nr:MAG: TraB/GumN family protein [Desulfobacterales bacterium]
MTLNQFYRNQRPNLLALLTTLAIIGTGAANAYASKSCLWSIQTRSNTVFLLGSIHFLKSDSYPLARAIERAYAASPQIVFETDMAAMNDPAIQGKVLALGTYPEGESLYQHITARTKRLLEEKMAATGLPPEQFARFRPWFLALNLTTLEILRLGFDPNFGIDLHFFGRAQQDGKRILFLEPIEYQLELLAGMDKRDQNAFLSQTLTELELVTSRTADMVKFWQSGDTANLHKILFESFKDHPQIHNRLLIERNRKWVREIEKMAKQKENYLVIVGAGHLVGPRSVVELIEKKGYEVRQH